MDDRADPQIPLRRVAAFDFDGTLSRRDTLVPFLAQVSGPHPVRRRSAAAWDWPVPAATSISGTGTGSRSSCSASSSPPHRVSELHAPRNPLRPRPAVRSDPGRGAASALDEHRRRRPRGRVRLRLAGVLPGAARRAARPQGVSPSSWHRTTTSRAGWHARTSEPSRRRSGCGSGSAAEGSPRVPNDPSSSGATATPRAITPCWRMSDHAYWLGRPNRVPPALRTSGPSRSEDTCGDLRTEAPVANGAQRHGPRLDGITRRRTP